MSAASTATPTPNAHPGAIFQLAPPKGSRVLVAGGCGGIGRVLVRALIDAGVEVAVFDMASSAAQHPPPAGVALFKVDASKPAEVDAAFTALDRHWQGGIHGFVNLVGFAADRTPIADLAVSEWERVVEGNLGSSYLLNRGAVPRLQRAGGGTVVNVASGLATRVMPGFGPYSASKAGLIALTKAIAVENAPAIRANTVAPAAIETDFLVGGTGREHTGSHLDREPYMRTIPMRRLGVPDDVVGPILFLLGPASAYMTGQTLYINGGGLTP
jgi:3-oxoacyl-[acyl-carrier protein] reductase